MSKDKIQKELEAEEKAKALEESQKNYKEYCEMHNTKPVTRRDFLSAGVLSFSATMALSPLALLTAPRSAFAQANPECPADAPAGGLSMAPFITVNLSGGAMLSANFVPMDQGGNPLPTYDKMGLGNGAVPIETEFGGATFAGNGISQLLAGIRAGASAATISNTACVGFCVRSRDDSSSNRFDASGMVTAGGFVGRQLSNLGTTDGDTGVRQNFARIKPPNPLRVSSYNDLQAAIGGTPKGALAGLNESQMGSLYRLIKNLSDKQTQRVLNDSGGRQLATLVDCATDKNVRLATQPKPTLDIRQNQTLAGIWGVNTGTNAGSQSMVFGSMVNAALTGVSGAVGLNMGGYDYHNRTRTTGDTRDFQAGQRVGQILETAAALGEKVFVYLTTDGACVSPVSNDRSAPWVSDRGGAGMAITFAFDPAGRPQTSGNQVGYYNAGQASEGSFVTGGSAELTAAAVFANYLQFNNKMNEFERVLPGLFTPAQLAQILKIS